MRPYLALGASLLAWQGLIWLLPRLDRQTDVRSPLSDSEGRRTLATALNISDVNVGDSGTEWDGGVSESPNFNDIPDNGPVSERVGGEGKFSYSVGISIVGRECK